MDKFIRDISSDEFGKDADLTSVASIIGFVVGMSLYMLSQFVYTAAWVPRFSLVDFAVGFAALIGSIATCQRLKPTAIDTSTKDSQ